jgi:hypothetical protein
VRDASVWVGAGHGMSRDDLELVGLRHGNACPFYEPGC